MYKLFAGLTLVLLLLGIGGCKSDGSTFTTGSAPATGSGGGTGSTGSAPTPGSGNDNSGPPTVSLGSGSGDNFKAGALASDSKKLSAGGSTTVRAFLVGSDGLPYTDSASINFISPCTQQGLASLTSPADAANGVATATYTNLGCKGSDTITAIATINDQKLTATGTVSDLSPVHLGSSSGKNFKDGALAIANDSLSANDSTQVTARLVNSDGSLFLGNNAKIAFTSNCAEQKQATLTSPVVIKDGIAVATYKATGCAGTDVIKATFSVGKQSVTATGKVHVATNAFLGSGAGSDFHKSVLVFGYGIDKLSAGASTKIRTTLVNDDMTPYTGSAKVTFSSECAQQGHATLDSTAAVVNGAAVANYTNTGCGSEDIVTATVTIDGHKLTATGHLHDEASVRFGSGSKKSFQDGVLAVSPTEIPAGGNTTVTANLLNTDGTPFVGDTQVSFSSTCVKQGQATISSPVKVKDGAAVATYAATGCSGNNDTITATFTVGEQKLTATGKISIADSVLFGSGTGSNNFLAGMLKIGVGADRLSAGGSTEVRATLVNDDYTLYTGAADVTFVSNCVQSGQASLTSPVALTNGGAESTYTAKGCVGSDLITATVTVNGHQFTATGTVDVASATVGSIRFLSADPTVMSFKDSGLADTSDVTFQVLDKAGHPVAGKVVDFALSTSVGGITLTEASAKSDGNGKVQAVVHAGTVHTPARVKATVEHTSSPISSQSSKLAISTGIVDADSFSISANELNPGGYDQDGVTDAVTVHLADRFNNPVLDGTAITFRTEGGSITPQCTTTNGQCQVTWTSQAPRPADGRVSILAYAIGEESFVDEDGDGRFNHNDTFTDLGEPYEDDDENGQYNASKVEPFADYNNDGRRNGPDGGYEGLQCETQCGPQGATPPGNLTTDIGAQLVLVMSGSNAKISTSTVCNPSSAPPTNPIGLSAGIAQFTLFVKDENCQTMPYNTSISLQASGGVKIDSKTSFKVENTNAKPVPPYLVLLENASAGSMITVTVTAPNGNITIAYIKFQ